MEVERYVLKSAVPPFLFQLGGTDQPRKDGWILGSEVECAGNMVFWFEKVLYRRNKGAVELCFT